MEYLMEGRRVSANSVYELSKANENRNKDSCRRNSSSTNHYRRSSLAQIFFGSNSGSHQNEKFPSQGLLSGRRFSKDSISTLHNNTKCVPVIPIDSRVKHEFCSDNESGNESGNETASEATLRRQSFDKSPKILRRNSKIIPLLSFSNQPTSNAHSGMRKVMRCVVVGAKKVGKTAMLQQLAHYQNICSQLYVPTIDDTYQIQTQVDADGRPKELIIFHDTAGVMDFGPLELKKPYVQVADAFILVYSVVDHESFNRMDLVKSFIDKQFGKDRKEIPIVVVGTMADLPNRQVDVEFALHWANREKEEPKFSITKRLKPEKTNAQIVMDF